ncbi:unnamed protein product [Alternaria alternata]
MSEAFNNLVTCDTPFNFSQVRIDFVRRWMAGSAYSETTSGHDWSLRWLHSQPNGANEPQEAKEDAEQDDKTEHREPTSRSRTIFAVATADALSEEYTYELEEDPHRQFALRAQAKLVEIRIRVDTQL